MPTVIPYGWAESTAAMRGILGGVVRGGASRGRKRRRKAKAARKTAKRAKRVRKGKKAHLVKGSAAAKKFMAKLRAKAKRKR